MNIAFRADSSYVLGTGHVRRCITLAKALKARGAFCVFFSIQCPGNINELIEAEGFIVYGDKHQMLEGNLKDKCNLLEDNIQQIASFKFRGSKWDWIVVDHYSLDSNWEKAARPSLPSI